MIAALLTGLAASPRVQAVLRYRSIVLAVLLFLLTLRRFGERAGRLAERLETTEKAMTSNARCWRRQRAVLVIATILLGGCATGGSEPPIATGCPPRVEYSREFQARVAEELDLLPDSSAIAEMLSRIAKRCPRSLARDRELRVSRRSPCRTAFRFGGWITSG